MKSLYPEVTVTTDSEQIIEDEDVHAIFIAVPLDHHFELSRRSLLAEKHTFIEKPMASSVLQHTPPGFPQYDTDRNISFCNLRCSMCSHKGMLRQPGIMNVELFKKIIDEIAAENKQVKTRSASM